MKQLKLKLCNEANAQSATTELVRGQNKNEQAFRAGAEINEAERSVDVIIISEGPGNEVDKNYYTKEAIESGIKLFEGARAFVNHQTEAERDSRPEQDVHQLCGFYKDCKTFTVFDPRQKKNVLALGAKLICDESEAGDLALSKAKAQILYSKLYPNSKECYAGISVNTGGWQDGDVEIAGEKWAKIVAFEGVQSADIVTRPGRGGGFLRFAESLGPEGSNNMKESEVKNIKEVKKLIAKLEESDKAVKAETNGAKKKELMSESAKLQEKLLKLMESEDEIKKEGEDEKKIEGEEPAADDDSAGADATDKADALAALKKHMAQNEDESEAEYSARVSQAFKHAEAAGMLDKKESEDEKKSEDEAKLKQESNRMRESEAVAKFRKDSPVQYRSMMASLRESLGAERLDFKGLKEANVMLRQEVSNLRLERDLAEAERELNEAGIPPQYAAAAELIRLDESARKRYIERTKMIMESAGASHVWSGNGPGGSKNMKESLDFGGIPTVEEKD